MIKDMIKNNRGFTLTEVMVTVLLLGIISTIAIPQYLKTVEKQKAVEALHLLSAIGRSEERYYVINEVYTEDYSDLDADLVDRSTKTAASGTTFNNSAFRFVLEGDATPQVTAIRNDAVEPPYCLMRVHETGVVCCESRDEDLCALFGVKEIGVDDDCEDLKCFP
ncbi:MAG: prepilin-type N-terminal cleavage/methylation domain-containing protein [Elusimicrobiota bacterium]|jgi:prepilin-type N-terminal cleavage/methylation domain-containing protein|nr:prepilin-type N-terminal cleavage/methylation domain-containing protein [Elusimicrobiota bacterium]